MALLAALSALAIGVLAGGALGALKWRRSAEQFHREARMAVILAQAGEMSPGGVLVIGDSVTERVKFDRLCGRPALNAGISWSTSNDWLPDVHAVIAAARPSVIVLEIGSNDHDRDANAHRWLHNLATFEIATPSSTVDGLHPDALGARQFIAEIEQGCATVAKSRSGRRATP